MRFRSAEAADLASMAELAAPLQARPDRHVVYLATEGAGIEAELSELNLQSASVVALSDDTPGNETIAGWLVGDVDDEIGGVWWIGPFVCDQVWQPLATELLAEGRRRLAAGVGHEELAVDGRFDGFEAWATDAGFVPATGSWVLTLDRTLDPDEGVVPVRRMVDGDGDEVAALHDELFPGTHTLGRQLVGHHDDRHPRLVSVSDGRVTGYVAVERQPDGSGYIDFVGVRPSERRRGLGRALVRAGVAALLAIDADPVHLTVRDDIVGARELYESLGFTEERLALPFRRGFPHPPPPQPPIS
ncbi:MAG: GNAT family N-acetyltransferase [Ilumatobacteraceae bacterium]